MQIRTAKYRVGDDAGVKGISGSLARASMLRVLEALRDHTGLNKGDSVLVDLGAGIGEPLAWALCHGFVSKTRGFEFDSVKVTRAATFMRLLQLDAEVHELDINAIDSLGDATHVYLAWQGFDAMTKEHIGRLLSLTPGVRGVAVVQHASRTGQRFLHEECGFPERLVIEKHFSVTMSGGKQRLMAYILGTAP